jgi:hypothetical protein
VHVEGEAEYPMMLSLSPPSSPKVDWETNIANGLEELRCRTSVLPTTSSYDVSCSSSPMPKSKWPFSTIGSIREEHERRGPSAKLGLYLGGGGKRASKNSKVPQTPTSMKSPSRTSYAMKSPASSMMTTSRPRAYGHRRHSSRESYIMIIGYGHGNGVRRRGSITPTISDAWGDDSALSSTRSRLRSSSHWVGFIVGSVSFSCFLSTFSSLLVFVAELRPQTNLIRSLMTLSS